MGDGDVCDNWEQFSEDNERLEKQLEKLTVGKSKARIDEEASEEISPTTGTPIEVPGSGGPTPQFRILLRKKEPVTSASGIGVPPSNPIPTTTIELDSTTEESLRTQYVPQLKILSRPKPPGGGENAASSSDKRQVTTKKSLAQREKEYNAARMRILGDVRFLEEEKEAELEATMTPAEILKMKVSRSVMNDDKVVPPGTVVVPSNPPGGGTMTGELFPVPPNEGQGGSTSVEGGGGGGVEGGSSKSKNKRRARSKGTPNPLLVTPPVHFPPSKTDSEWIVRQPRGPDGTPGFNNSPR